MHPEIPLSVAAGALLFLLGVIGFFLRKMIADNEDDIEELKKKDEQERNDIGALRNDLIKREGEILWLRSELEHEREWRGLLQKQIDSLDRRKASTSAMQAMRGEPPEESASGEESPKGRLPPYRGRERSRPFGGSGGE